MQLPHFRGEVYAHVVYLKLEEGEFIEIQGYTRLFQQKEDRSPIRH